MTDVLLRILRLRHAPKKKLVQGRSILLILDILQHFTEEQRGRFSDESSVFTEKPCHMHKFIDLQLIRFLVDTIYERTFHLIKPFRDRFISGDHEFLDHTMDRIDRIRIYIDRFSLIIKFHMRLREHKIYITAFLSLLFQDITEL